MRNYVKSVVCAVAAVTLVFMGAPAARADDDSFFAAARAIGLPLSFDNMIKSGRSICYFLVQRNRDPDEIASHTKRYANITADQAHQFMVLSVNEYCPQWGQLVGP